MPVLVTIALGGGAVVATATNWGPWAGSDSVEYFEAAANFADGRGLVLVRASGAVHPLSLRPPLYPILLGLIHQQSVPLLAAARLISIATAAAFLFAVGQLVHSSTSDSLYAAASILVLGTSPTLLESFAGAMSEGTFYALGAVCWVFLFRYLQSRRTALLLAAGMLAGLAILARFAGVAWALASVAGLMVFSRRNLRSKLFDAVRFSLLSATPVLIWQVYVLALGGSAANYRTDLGGIWSRLAPVRVAIVETLWGWLPIAQVLDPGYRTKLIALIGFAAALAALAKAGVRRWRASERGMPEANRPPLLIGLTTCFTAAYVAFIAAAFLFVEDPKPALNERILGPIQVGVFATGIVIGACFSRLFSSQIVHRLIPFAIAVPLVAYQVPDFVDLIADLHQNGRGYSSRTWQSSQLIRIATTLPSELTLISNDIEAIMFHLGRPAYRMSELEHGTERQSLGAFGTSAEDPVETIFRQERAALVLFDSAYWQFHAIYGSRTDDRWAALTEGLQLYADATDGRIYFYGEG